MSAPMKVAIITGAGTGIGRSVVLGTGVSGQQVLHPLHHGQAVEFAHYRAMTYTAAYHVTGERRSLCPLRNLYPVSTRNSVYAPLSTVLGQRPAMAVRSCALKQLPPCRRRRRRLSTLTS